MSQITITDEAILAELRSGRASITVRDGTGKVCGVLMPLRPDDLQPQISEEEIARRVADRGKGGYTTEQVLEHLKGLRKGQ
jgi:hypothetical protein